MRNYFMAGLLAVATAAALGGCTKEIAIQPNAYVPKLGIECVLVPDSLPKVYLTRSQSFLGTNVNAMPCPTRPSKSARTARRKRSRRPRFSTTIPA